MTTMKNSIHDNANGLDYTLVNDHYLPNLTAAAPAEQHPTGRWGRLHKMYLKEQHPIRYNQLLLSGELGGYLAKLDKQAEEQLAFYWEKPIRRSVKPHHPGENDPYLPEEIRGQHFDSWTDLAKVLGYGE